MLLTDFLIRCSKKIRTNRMNEKSMMEIKVRIEERIQSHEGMSD